MIGGAFTADVAPRAPLGVRIVLCNAGVVGLHGFSELRRVAQLDSDLGHLEDVAFFFILRNGADAGGQQCGSAKRQDRFGNFHELTPCQGLRDMAFFLPPIVIYITYIRPLQTGKSPVVSATVRIVRRQVSGDWAGSAGPTRIACRRRSSAAVTSNRQPPSSTISSTSGT